MSRQKTHSILKLYFGGHKRNMSCLFVLTLASTVPAASARLCAARALNGSSFAIRTQFNCLATAADCPVEWRSGSGERDMLVEQPEAPALQALAASAACVSG